MDDRSVFTEEHRYNRTNIHQCEKNLPCNDTCRSYYRSASLTYGILRPILVFSPNVSRKAAIRPIVRKIQ